MSLNPGVRAIIGADAVGAIVEGTVLGLDPASGLTRVGVGGGELKVLVRRRPRPAQSCAYSCWRAISSWRLGNRSS